MAGSLRKNDNQPRLKDFTKKNVKILTCNTCIMQIPLSSDYLVPCKKLQNLLDSDK